MKKKRFVEIKKKNPWVRGVVSGDIELSLWQKVRILFSSGITVTFVGLHEAGFK